MIDLTQSIFKHKMYSPCIFATLYMYFHVAMTHSFLPSPACSDVVVVDKVQEMMVYQTMGNPFRTTTSCISALLLLTGDTSAFLAPSSHAVIRTSSLFSTTEEAAPAIINESYAAPLNEIERRRNLAIISHPDSGKFGLFILG